MSHLKNMELVQEEVFGNLFRMQETIDNLDEVDKVMESTKKQLLYVSTHHLNRTYLQLVNELTENLDVGISKTVQKKEHLEKNKRQQTSDNASQHFGLQDQYNSLVHLPKKANIMLKTVHQTKTKIEGFPAVNKSDGVGRKRQLLPNSPKDQDKITCNSKNICKKRKLDFSVVFSNKLFMQQQGSMNMTIPVARKKFIGPTEAVPVDSIAIIVNTNKPGTSYKYPIEKPEYRLSKMTAANLNRAGQKITLTVLEKCRKMINLSTEDCIDITDAVLVQELHKEYNKIYQSSKFKKIKGREETFLNSPHRTITLIQSSPGSSTEDSSETECQKQILEDEKSEENEIKYINVKADTQTLVDCKNILPKKQKHLDDYRQGSYAQPSDLKHGNPYPDIVPLPIQTDLEILTLKYADKMISNTNHNDVLTVSSPLPLATANNSSVDGNSNINSTENSLNGHPICSPMLSIISEVASEHTLIDRKDEEVTRTGNLITPIDLSDNLQAVGELSSSSKKTSAGGNDRIVNENSNSNGENNFMLINTCVELKPADNKYISTQKSNSFIAQTNSSSSNSKNFKQGFTSSNCNSGSVAAKNKFSQDNQNMNPDSVTSSNDININSMDTFDVKTENGIKILDSDNNIKVSHNSGAFEGGNTAVSGEIPNDLGKSSESRYLSNLSTVVHKNSPGCSDCQHNLSEQNCDISVPVIVPNTSPSSIKQHGIKNSDDFSNLCTNGIIPKNNCIKIREEDGNPQEICSKTDRDAVKVWDNNRLCNNEVIPQSGENITAPFEYDEYKDDKICILQPSSNALQHADDDSHNNNLLSSNNEANTTSLHYHDNANASTDTNYNGSITLTSIPDSSNFSKPQKDTENLSETKFSENIKSYVDHLNNENICKNISTKTDNNNSTTEQNEAPHENLQLSISSDPNVSEADSCSTNDTKSENFKCDTGSLLKLPYISSEIGVRPNLLNKTSHNVPNLDLQKTLQAYVPPINTSFSCELKCDKKTVDTNCTITSEHSKEGNTVSKTHARSDCDRSQEKSETAEKILTSVQNNATNTPSCSTIKNNSTTTTLKSNANVISNTNQKNTSRKRQTVSSLNGRKSNKKFKSNLIQKPPASQYAIFGNSNVDFNEIADNNDPRWKLFNFSEPQDFFLAVCNQWSDRMPNPHIDLTKRFYSSVQPYCTNYSLSRNNAQNSVGFSKVFENRLEQLTTKMSKLKNDLDTYRHYRCDRDSRRTLSQLMHLQDDYDKIHAAWAEATHFYTFSTNSEKDQEHGYMSEFNKDEVAHSLNMLEAYKDFYGVTGGDH